MKGAPRVKSKTAAEEKTAPTGMARLRGTYLVRANARAARNQGSYVLLPGTVHGLAHGGYLSKFPRCFSRSGVGAAKARCTNRTEMNLIQ